MIRTALFACKVRLDWWAVLVEGGSGGGLDGGSGGAAHPVYAKVRDEQIECVARHANAHEARHQP